MSARFQLITPDAKYADDRQVERRIAQMDVGCTIGCERNSVRQATPWTTRAKTWFVISGIKKPIVLVCCARAAAFD